MTAKRESAAFIRKQLPPDVVHGLDSFCSTDASFREKVTECIDGYSYFPKGVNMRNLAEELENMVTTEKERRENIANAAYIRENLPTALTEKLDKLRFLDDLFSEKVDKCIKKFGKDPVMSMVEQALRRLIDEETKKTTADGHSSLGQDQFSNMVRNVLLAMSGVVTKNEGSFVYVEHHLNQMSQKAIDWNYHMKYENGVWFTPSLQENKSAATENGLTRKELIDRVFSPIKSENNEVLVSDASNLASASIFIAITKDKAFIHCLDDSDYQETQPITELLLYNLPEPILPAHLVSKLERTLNEFSEFISEKQLEMSLNYDKKGMIFIIQFNQTAIEDQLLSVLKSKANLEDALYSVDVLKMVSNPTCPLETDVLIIQLNDSNEITVSGVASSIAILDSQSFSRRHMDLDMLIDRSLCKRAALPLSRLTNATIVAIGPSGRRVGPGQYCAEVAIANRGVFVKDAGDDKDIKSVLYKTIIENSKEISPSNEETKDELHVQPFNWNSHTDTGNLREFIKAFTQTVFWMAKNKIFLNLSHSNTIGAIIILQSEKCSYLDGLIKNCKPALLNACFSQQLLHSIFETNSPMHDGAAIIRFSDKGAVIYAARIMVPLPDDLKAGEYSRSVGTRHRASIALSRGSKTSLVVTVSEESGELSCLKLGQVSKVLDLETFKKIVETHFDG